MHQSSHDTNSEMVETGKKKYEDARAKKETQSGDYVAKKMESYVANANATKSVSQSKECCINDSNSLESNASNEIAAF